MTIETLIATYGLPAVGIGAVIEGETVVMIGGAMASRGLLEKDWLIGAAALGSFLGDQGWFFLGRRWRDLPRLRRLADTPIFGKVQRVFDRYPGLFVFGFRFAYGLRTVSPIAIGITGYPAGRFVAINAVAALVWAWLFVTLGGVLGQGFETVLGPLKTHEHLLLVLLVAGFLAALMRRLRRHKGIQCEGEVVHFVVHRIEDLSRELSSVGARDEAFPLRQGRGDETRHGAPTDDLRKETPLGPRAREIYIRDLSLHAIKVKGRNFQ